MPLKKSRNPKGCDQNPVSSFRTLEGSCHTARPHKISSRRPDRDWRICSIGNNWYSPLLQSHSKRRDDRSSTAEHLFRWASLLQSCGICVARALGAVGTVGLASCSNDALEQSSFSCGATTFYAANQWISKLDPKEKAKFSLTSCSNHCRERDSHFSIPPLSKGWKGCEPHPGRQIDRDGEGTKRTNQSIDFG